MSRDQDRYGHARSPIGSSADDLSWIAATGRDGEMLRAVRDGTHMSTSDRIGYALSLIKNPDTRSSIGRSEKQLRRYADGDDVPLSVLVAISALSGLPIDWIVSGRAKTDREVAEWLHGEDVDDWVDGTNLSCPAASSPAATVSVPLFAVAASAGHGSFSTGGSSSESVDLPLQILDQVGCKAANARILRAVGSSMEPTIGDGDLLLVDVSKDRRTPVEGRIFVFSVGDELFVKRLRRSLNGWMMVSDNRAHFSDEPIPPEAPVTIHGRVVWAGRKLP